MFITLEELKLHRVVVSKTYAFGALNFRGAEFQQLGPLKVDAIADLEGSEIHIRGHLAGKLRAECDRCLARVDIPLDRNFDLFYWPIESIARDEEIEVPEKELNVGFYSGSGIALADLVTEQVILSVPMKVVCRAECGGLCPVCGADRNQLDCGCQKPRGDSPFASLLGD